MPQGHDYVPSHAVLGVLLCILGGIVDNTGVTIQKLSHRKNLQVISYTPYWRCPLWIFGFCMYMVGTICNAIGLSLAPQSDFAAVGTLTLVTNAVNSSCLLHEQINRTIVIGILIVITGSLTAVAFGATGHVASVKSVENLSSASAIYACFLVCFIAIVYVLIRVLRRHYRLKQDLLLSSQALSPLLDHSAGDIAVDSYPHPSFNIVTHSEVNSKFLAVLLPIFAGTIGSITVLFAKAMTVLIRTSFRGENQFMHWQLYAIIVITIVLGISQIHWLNMALRSYDQLIVVPAFVVSMEVFNVLGGLIFYQEDRDLSTSCIIVFPLAVMISFAGVVVIAVGLRSRPPAYQQA